jgi:exodeoxyribonuclease VII large subunit
VQRERQLLDHRRQLLQALSPQQLLGRGFSLVRDGQGQIVSSIGQLKAGDGVMIELADGALDATVGQLHRHQPCPGQPEAKPNRSAPSPRMAKGTTKSLPT